MKDTWEIVSMGQLCSITTGKSDTKDAVEDGAYAFFDRSRSIKKSSRYLYDCEALIIPGEGTEFLPKHFIGKFDLHQRAYALFDFSDRVDVRFLYYFLHHRADYFPRVAVGATVKSLRQRHFEQLPVSLTSRSEQKRIVSVLDEAFARIAVAKASVARSLHNARALFDSQLQSVFTHADGPLEIKLAELATFRNGINFTKSSLGESVKIVGVRNFQQHFWAPLDDLDTVTIEGALPDTDALRENDVLFVRSNGNVDLIGRCLLVGPVVGRIAHSGFTIRARLSGRDLIAKYLCYFLKSKSARRKMIDGGIGTNIKSLSQATLSALVVPLPSIDEQVAIASRLDALAHATERLESVYRRKRDALDGLGRSLLHQAFTGQLTATQVSSGSGAASSAASVPGLTTTDMHAGVLAMALELHEKSGKLKSFTRVKAEKIAHMIEAHLGIDLGRSPVKDAAGPNDFPHLLRVEHRARMANYFDFKQTGLAYRVQKRRGFDRLVEKTHAALGDRRVEVERLLQRMLPMSVQQAEIAATVFAAWNNLLLDGAHPTDEEIVSEARECWHPEKLKIDRQRFFAALKWLSEQGVQPEGRGKRVVSKGAKSASKR